MKKVHINIILYLLSLVILANTVASCNNDSLFRETNTNKEAFSSIDPNLLLTTVQASMSGGRLEQWRANLIYGEGFIQHLGGSWSTSNYGAFFKHNAGYEVALWNSNYGEGLVRDLIDLQERTKNTASLNNLNAISKILKVMVFQRLTDTYGDVPFSEAGLGYYGNIYLPKYDKQEDIYNEFFVLLKDAYNQLDDGINGDKITSDNFYNGDILKWKKLANSLRLRCAMRISMVDESKAKIEINEAISNGLFESNADNCFTRHDATLFNIKGAEKNGNGFSQALKGAGSVLDHPTDILLRKLNNDPRKNIWFTLGKSGAIEGIAANNYRWDHPGGSDNLGIIQEYLYKNDGPYLHISYSEVQLLLAEATQRSLISGNAQDFYQKGIEAGIMQWTSLGATVDSSIANTFAMSKTLTTGKELEEIATQQWLTLFLNGMEAYANQRRTDMPVLDSVTRTDTNTNGVMPKRMPYPVGESTANKANYNAAKENYPEGWLSRVWWDIK